MCFHSISAVCPPYFKPRLLLHTMWQQQYYHARDAARLDIIGDVGRYLVAKDLSIGAPTSLWKSIQGGDSVVFLGRERWGCHLLCRPRIFLQTQEGRFPAYMCTQVPAPSHLPINSTHR